MTLEVRDGGNIREKAKASAGMRRRQLGPGGGCRAISRDIFSAGAATHKERGEQERPPWVLLQGQWLGRDTLRRGQKLVGTPDGVVTAASRG